MDAQGFFILSEQSSVKCSLSFSVCWLNLVTVLLFMCQTCFLPLYKSNVKLKWMLNQNFDYEAIETFFFFTKVITYKVYFKLQVLADTSLLFDLFIFGINMFTCNHGLNECYTYLFKNDQPVHHNCHVIFTFVIARKSRFIFCYLCNRASDDWIMLLPLMLV